MINDCKPEPSIIRDYTKMTDNQLQVLVNKGYEDAISELARRVKQLIPKDKPPLLSDEEIENIPHCWTEPNTNLREGLIAQAQREADIKWYEGAK